MTTPARARLAIAAIVTVVSVVGLSSSAAAAAGSPAPARPALRTSAPRSFSGMILHCAAVMRRSGTQPSGGFGSMMDDANQPGSAGLMGGGSMMGH